MEKPDDNDSEKQLERLEHLIETLKDTVDYELPVSRHNLEALLRKVQTNEPPIDLREIQARYRHAELSPAEFIIGYCAWESLKRQQPDRKEIEQLLKKIGGNESAQDDTSLSWLAEGLEGLSRLEIIQILTTLTPADIGTMERLTRESRNGDEAEVAILSHFKLTADQVRVLLYMSLHQFRLLEKYAIGQ